MQSPIKQLTESIYHLMLDNKQNDNCVFCSDELKEHIAQLAIAKQSALIVEPTINNSRHECNPKADAIKHFSSIAYILTGDSATFTRHITHATTIEDAHPKTAMFASYEDAYSWSVAKLATA